jgi:tetratricopeptide (TPR) repeat protein
MNPRQISNSLESLSLDSLLAEATQHLQARRFKEAIRYYKEVRKRSLDNDSQARLEQAYQGRARELAAKRMHPEAVVIWEQMELSCGRPADASFYVWELIQVDNGAKAVAVYLAERERQKTTGRNAWPGSDLDALMAMFVILDDPAIVRFIPAESPLMQQRPHIETALDALADPSAEGRTRLREALRRIGFNSPYRDWRQLILGLSEAAGGDRLKAADCFRKIAPESLLSPLTTVLTLFMSEPPPETLLANVAALPPFQFDLLNFFLDAAGEQLLLLKKIIQLAGQADRKKILRELRSDTAQLPTSLQARLYRKCLPIFPPALLPEYEKQCGPLSEFEKAWLTARHYQQQPQSLRKANEFWARCLKIVEEAKLELPPLFEANRPKIAALLLTQMARNERETEERKCQCRCPACQQKTLYSRGYRRCLHLFTESLKYDPTDEQIYDEIIGYYQMTNDLVGQAKWIDKKIEQFSDHINALLAGAHVALARDVLQKAIRYLNRILEIEPLNKDAHRLLMDVYLNSARKRLLENKFRMVRLDFKKALELEDPREKTGMIELYWGLSEVFMGKFQLGQFLINDGLRIAKYHVAAYYRLLTEARQLGVDWRYMTGFEQHFETLLKMQGSAADVLMLVNLAANYERSRRDRLGRTDYIHKVCDYINRHAHLSYGQEALLQICEFLDRVEEYRDLKLFSSQGRNAFPDQTIFLLYEIKGKVKGQATKMSRREQQLLEDAAQRCKQANDLKTMNHIIEFLESAKKKRLGPDEPLSMKNITELMQQVGALDQERIDLLIDLLGESEGAPRDKH